MATESQPRVMSARNQLRGRVLSVKFEPNGVVAEVTLDCGGQEVVSVITRDSVERLGLREGEEAFALIKATDVMIGR
jgi:molybdopterin-binding protein